MGAEGLESHSTQGDTQFYLYLATKDDFDMQNWQLRFDTDWTKSQMIDEIFQVPKSRHKDRDEEKSISKAHNFAMNFILSFFLKFIFGWIWWRTSHVAISVADL